MIYAGKGVGLLLGIPDRLPLYDKDFLMAIMMVTSVVITIAIAPMSTMVFIIVSRPPCRIPTPYASTRIIE